MPLKLESCFIVTFTGQHLQNSTGPSQFIIFPLTWSRVREYFYTKELIMQQYPLKNSKQKVDFGTRTLCWVFWYFKNVYFNVSDLNFFEWIHDVKELHFSIPRQSTYLEMNFKKKT